MSRSQWLVGSALAILIQGCGSPVREKAPAPTAKIPAHPAAAVASAEPVPTVKPAYVYVTERMPDPALPRRLASHAQRARRLGLRPLVFIRTTWNPAYRLAKREQVDPKVREALRDWYIIDVEYDDDCLDSDCAKPLFETVMCGTWGPSWHELDRDGRPGPPLGGGGKEGQWFQHTSLRVLANLRALLADIDRGAEPAPCVPL